MARLSIGVVTELKARTLRDAAALKATGIGPGDAVAIAMPMTAESVVIYLAIVWIGAAVVSIADSFSAEEIRTRLDISETTLVFTQDHIVARAVRLFLCTRDWSKPDRNR